jgi:Cdc6-like AAA superfamily ATPase
VTGSGDLRHPLSTREGWAAFASRARPEPPRLLPGTDLERLTAVEREIYDEGRQDHHSELLLVATPDIRQITTTGSKLIINNRGKQLGRRGLIVSGPSGTGKSTSITQLGKKHQIETERRHPGLTGRIPVVYIIVPPAATPKTLAIELAAFLGLPVSSRDSQHAITQAVAGVLRKVGCSLVLVDEVHRLDLRTRSVCSMVAISLAQSVRWAAVACPNAQVRTLMNRPAICRPRMPENMPFSSRSSPA